jgi:hypothetical protein
VSLDNGYSISLTILVAGNVNPTVLGMQLSPDGKLQGQECRWKSMLAQLGKIAGDHQRSELRRNIVLSFPGL